MRSGLVAAVANLGKRSKATGNGICSMTAA